MKIGTDIVQISRFREKLEKNRWKFERDVFFEGEASDDSAEHLAGIFAAKEAALKALDLAPGNWKYIEIKKSNSGKPMLGLSGYAKNITKTCELSISHAGDYATATVICDY